MTPGRAPGQRPALERARRNDHVRERPFARRCVGPSQRRPSAAALERHDGRAATESASSARIVPRRPAGIRESPGSRDSVGDANRMWQIAEGGQDPARVGAHRRPNAAVRAVAAPLAADRRPAFEQHRFEAFRRQIARRRQTGRAGADDPDFSHQSPPSSPHAAVKGKRPRLIRTCGGPACIRRVSCGDC